MIRLYYTDPSTRRFEARVVRAADDGPRQRVWLDHTAFYPSSGGQPYDTGLLNHLPVIDVTEGDEGQVVHVVHAGLAVGDTVIGEIDWQRRFDHMQQHTGQHILSAAFERLHEVRTESFRLGEEFSTIDLARPVSAAEVTAAEEDANRIVWEGRPVSIRFVSDEEAARLPLRKPPARAGRLRLIEVDGYDLSACGGTHVSRTGEVGLIAVRGSERFRGGTRLEFVCGGRALASYRRLRQAAADAGRLLSVSSEGLAAAVEGLQLEAKETRHTLRRLAEKTTGLEAEALATRATAIGSVSAVVEALDGYDLNALKLIAEAFVKAPARARVIVLFSVGETAQVVAMRSADLVRLDCGGVVSALTKQFGGRGGGRPEGAQGGGLNAPVPALVQGAARVLADALSEH